MTLIPLAIGLMFYGWLLSRWFNRPLEVSLGDVLNGWEVVGAIGDSLHLVKDEDSVLVSRGQLNRFLKTHGGSNKRST